MSKKHYIAIAAMLREVDSQQHSSVELYKSSLVSKLAVYFGNDNEWFCSARFRAACYAVTEDTNND